MHYLGEFCGGGLVRRNWSFRDGSSAWVGSCDNPGYRGSFADSGGGYTHIPRPPNGWLGEVFVAAYLAAGQGAAGERAGEAAALAAEPAVREHVRSHVASVANRFNEGNAAYAAKHPNYQWTTLTAETLFKSVWEET